MYLTFQASVHLLTADSNFRIVKISVSIITWCVQCTFDPSGEIWS